MTADCPACQMGSRRWILNDGSRLGRAPHTQPGSGLTNNWGVLWRFLREGVDDGCYHDGSAVLGFEVQADGELLRFTDGRSDRFDVFVGADG